jgi:hypothetical protein
MSDISREKMDNYIWGILLFLNNIGCTSVKFTNKFNTLPRFSLYLLNIGCGSAIIRKHTFYNCPHLSLYLFDKEMEIKWTVNLH